MIKKNLVNLLSHAKKYVVYNVLCQWIALLAQIAAIFTISGLLEKIIYGNVHRLFEINGKPIVQTKINEYFPFLLSQVAEYKINDDIIDRTILLCAEVNAYIKKKQSSWYEKKERTRNKVLKIEKLKQKLL